VWGTCVRTDADTHLSGMGGNALLVELEERVQAGGACTEEQAAQGRTEPHTQPHTRSPPRATRSTKSAANISAMSAANISAMFQ
jgi:hypothetical protein